MIASPQQQGYHVIVTRTGTTPLDQAVVVAIRPGQTYSHTDRAAPGVIHATESLTGQTVYADVAAPPDSRNRRG